MMPERAVQQFKEYIDIFGEDGENCLYPEETRDALEVLESMAHDVVIVRAYMESKEAELRGIQLAFAELKKSYDKQEETIQTLRDLREIESRCY